MSVPLYEWNEGKRRANLVRHGVDFRSAERFDWGRAIELCDDRRDYGEERWIAIDPIDGRVHVLIYTPRGAAVRIISLRKANPRERRAYDQAQT